MLFIHREALSWMEEGPQMDCQSLTAKHPDTHTVSSRARFHVYSHCDLRGLMVLCQGSHEITVIFWCQDYCKLFLKLRPLSLIFEQFMFMSVPCCFFFFFQNMHVECDIYLSVSNQCIPAHTSSVANQSRSLTSILSKNVSIKVSRISVPS